MKKIFMAALAAATLSVSANAQDLSFIIQGGYQGAKLTSFDAQELASGFRIGAALDWRFLDLGVTELSLQPGVNFSQKGTNLIGTVRNGQSIIDLVNSPSLDNAINAALKMNYVDIPVLLNARFAIPVVGSVFVQAGPYVAFGIGSSTKITTGDKTVDSALDNITKILDQNQGHDAFKSKLMDKIDYGLQFGAGLEFSRILIGAGYQLGLKNVVNKDASVSENADVIGAAMKNAFKDGTKNSSFYVTIGYRF